MNISLSFNPDSYDEIIEALAIITTIRDSLYEVDEPVHEGVVDVAVKVVSVPDVGEEATQEEILAATDTDKVITPATITHAVPAGVEVDSENLPWDERIHTEKRTKLKKTGTWKLKRNIDPALVEQVKNELQAAMGSPTPEETPAPDFGGATVTSEPVVDEMPAADPVAIFGGQNVAEPPTNVVPLPPGAPTQQEQPAAEVVPVDFPALLTSISPRVADPTHGAAFNQIMSDILGKHNIANLPLLMNRPDLVPTIHAELETAWNNLNTQG